MTTVHLIDASPYIFRAYFSLPDSIVTRDGDPANAIYGFAGFLQRFVAEENPTHAACCFDESLTTCFRNDVYPEYKAQRELPPEELVAQLQSCKELATALGFAVFADLRYEADDLIGTLCRERRTEDNDVVVMTSDKDLGQLVDEHVELFDFAKGEHLGPQQIEVKFGVRPAQIPDYLGLAGDSVDNIPGVPGVGSKTAAALLAEFDDLDAVYADLDRVAELSVRGAKSLRKKLEEHRELALLSRQLATIALDAPASATLDELELAGAVPSLVDPLFERLGFGTIVDRITRWAEPRAASSSLDD